MDVTPALLPRPAPLPDLTPRLPAEWTFWADTMPGYEQAHRAARPLGPIQPVAFNFTRVLGGFGSGEIQLPVASSALDQTQLLQIGPRYRIWCFYAGQPVWCGYPTGISDSGAPAVTVTLAELTTYLELRQWSESRDPVRYTNKEQVDIAEIIAAPLRDVGVVIEKSAGPGQLRTREYEFLATNSRAEMLTNLSEVIKGPQFTTLYRMAGGMPECVLRIAYPRIGGATGLGLTVPGTATGFSVKWDADQLRTRTWAVGAQPDAENTPADARAPVARYQRNDLHSAGWPLIERVDQHEGVSEQSTLTERAESNGQIYAEPVMDISAEGTISQPPITAYIPGDDVTITLVTPLLPGGLDHTGQLREVSVNAADATVGWTVAVRVPPPKPRETLTARLDRIDLAQQGAFRRRLSVVSDQEVS